MMINQLIKNLEASYFESTPYPDGPAIPSGGFDIAVLTTRLSILDDWRANLIVPSI
jgi:hypothetical protein